MDGLHAWPGQEKWDTALKAIEEASRDLKLDQQELRHLKIWVLAGNPATANKAIAYTVDLAAVTRNIGGYDSIGHSRSYFYMAQNLMPGFETSPDPQFPDLAIALAEWAIEDLRQREHDRLELEYEIQQLQARAHASRSDTRGQSPTRSRHWLHWLCYRRSTRSIGSKTGNRSTKPYSRRRSRSTRRV